MVLISTTMQAKALAPAAKDENGAEYRARLLDGFAQATAERGYASVTIADIVRHARVSKRTFYEHFADKEACLLATYEGATEALRVAIRAAFEANEQRHWRDLFDAVLDAYVSALEAQPTLTRTCLVETAAAGPRAREVWRRERKEFVAMLRELVDRARARHPEVRALSESMATAVVGGIDELLLAQVERGPQHRLANLRDTASELLRAVLSPPAAPAPAPAAPAPAAPASPRRRRA